VQESHDLIKVTYYKYIANVAWVLGRPIGETELLNFTFMR